MLDHSLITETIPRRTRRKREVRQKIYTSAIDLFRRRGYERTTIQDICDVADTAKQTFFNYFPGKEDLLAAYHSELIREILEQISRMSQSSPTDSVISAMRIFAGRVRKSVSLSRAILRHVFSSRVLEMTDQKNEEKIYSWFHSQFSEGIRSGEFHSDLNLRLLTAVVMSVLSSTVQESLVSDKNFDLEEELVHRTRFILRLAGHTRRSSKSKKKSQ